MAVIINSNRQGRPILNGVRHNAILNGQKIWVTARTINFNVKHSITNANLSGVTVKAGSFSASTNASGNCSLILPDGAYTVTVSASGYTTVTYSLTVNASTGTQNRTLTPVDNTYLSGLFHWYSATKSNFSVDNTMWSDVRGGNGNGSCSITNATRSANEVLFNGKNTYGMLPSSLQFLTGMFGSNITVLFRYNPQATNYKGVIGPHFANGTGNPGFNWAQHEAGNISFGFYPLANGSANAIIYLAYNTSNFPNGLTAYHEISMNYDKNIIAVYVNGVFKQQLTVGLQNMRNVNFEFGRSFANTDRYLSGGIRDIKLYDRTLTSTQIQQNYNQNKSEGLVA